MNFKELNNKLKALDIRAENGDASNNNLAYASKGYNDKFIFFNRYDEAILKVDERDNVIIRKGHCVHVETLNLIKDFLKTPPFARCGHAKYQMVILGKVDEPNKNICYAKDDGSYRLWTYNPQKFHNKYKFMFTEDELNDLYKYIDNTYNDLRLSSIVRMGTRKVVD